MNILIVDDEPLARERLRTLLTGLPDAVVVGEAESVVEARQVLAEERIDVVLLDVMMPGGDGFGLVGELPPDGERPAVIFVTAFDEHALRAFEVAAIDYLVKPVARERLYEALAVARQRSEAGIEQRAVDSLRRALVERGDPAPRHFLVRNGRRLLFVRVPTIDWIEAAGNYVRLHHGNKSNLLRSTVTELAARLDPQRFVRIHRSTIVNLERVAEMEHVARGDYALYLGDGTRLVLSHAYREAFERALPSSRSALGEVNER